MQETRLDRTELAAREEPKPRGWLATGGLLGGILASSCCILPLALLMAGVSGAWIANLTVLEPYKPVFAAIAAIFIGLGFRQVYFKPRTVCEPDSYCARPQASITTKVALWIGTILVALAVTIDWWAPLFY